MNIAILGFGTVGKGIYEIVEKLNNQVNKDSFIGKPSAKHVIKMKYILTRKGTPKVLSEMTDDFNEIVNDPDIDCIVEVLGGRHPAKEYIMEALSKGKHVVTANKEAVARYYTVFMRLANESGVQFRFEASVGGGIPWLKSLSDLTRIDEVHSLYGILNGTTNFILDQMTRYQATFKEALAEAQLLGYAEKDPSNDIDGIDLRNKLAISMITAFGGYTNMSLIPQQGIRTITQEEITFYKNRNLTVKLMVFAKKYSDGYDAGIQPVLFPQDTIGAHVQSNDNLVVAIGDTIGKLQWIGQGAGKLPTANAIVQDILDIVENRVQSNICLLPCELALTQSSFGQFWLFASNKITSQKMIELLFPDKIEEMNHEVDGIYYKTKKMLVNTFYESVSLMKEQGMLVNYARIFDFDEIQEIEIDKEEVDA